MKTATVTLEADGIFRKLTFTILINGVVDFEQVGFFLGPSVYTTNDAEFNRLQATLRNWQTVAETVHATFSTSAGVVALVEQLSK